MKDLQRNSWKFPRRLALLSLVVGATSLTATTFTFLYYRLFPGLASVYCDSDDPKSACFAVFSHLILHLDPALGAVAIVMGLVALRQAKGYQEFLRLRMAWYGIVTGLLQPAIWLLHISIPR